MSVIDACQGEEGRGSGERETEREGEKETERDRDRERERQREIGRETEREGLDSHNCSKEFFSIFSNPKMSRMPIQERAVAEVFSLRTKLISVMIHLKSE
jgi:hypothetical protein